MNLATSSQTPVVCLIRTPRLLLRPLGPADSESLCDLIKANLAFLQRWMTWARSEPVLVEQKVTQLHDQRRNTLAGRTQGFGMFRPDGSKLLGAIGTHPRIGAGAREIGYWVGEAHARQGLTSEAAAALVRVGFEAQRLRRMEIHTDPDNLASIGVARKVGFHEQVVVRGCILTADGPVRDNVLWSMSRDAYAASPAAKMPVAAFDRRDRQVM